MSPWKLPKPCAQPNCSKLTHDRYCKVHAKLLRAAIVSRDQTTVEGLEIRAFYVSRAWRRRRREHLLAEPLCRVCGIVGEEVDHIIPIKLGGDKWDESNLQTLCNRHHQQKRQRESLQLRGTINKKICT